MRVKQKSVKSFEFEISDERSFINYFSKNAPLFKGHLLFLKGDVSRRIREHLLAHNSCFVEEGNCSLETKKRGSSIQIEAYSSSSTIQVSKAEESEDAQALESKIYYRTIRSGEELESQGDLTIFSSVNSGARVIAEGNLSIFGIINGTVIANGEYLLLQKIDKGTVMFRGQIVKKNQLKDGLNILRLNGSTLEVGEL